MEDLIKGIERYMRDNNLSVAKFAQEVGVTRQYIHRLVARTQQPSLRMAEQLGKHVGIDVKVKIICKRA